MNLETVDTLRHTIQVTVNSLATSLVEHMPPGSQRDYYLWAISSSNPHQEDFLKTIGVIQLAALTVKLTEGLFDTEKWLQMIDCCGQLNALFVYEVISDNVALGLAVSASARDADQQNRFDLLSNFNNVMGAALQDKDLAVKDLLTPYLPAARQVSLFAQSLTRTTQERLAATYLQRNQDITMHELEYGLWPFLVANIQAARVMVAQIAPAELQALACVSLQQRYQAMNVLMQGKEHGVREMVWIGSRSIMVVPVLLYYISRILQPALDTFEKPEVDCQAMLEDGILEDVLYDAALLIRLLNDLGTDVLQQSEQDRKKFFRALERWTVDQLPEVSLLDLLINVSGEYRQLGRLQKDAVFGEFNLALSGMNLNNRALYSLDDLQERLSMYSNLYKITYKSFQQGLERLSGVVKEQSIPRLIQRFVQFHENLYRLNGSNEYTL